MADTLPRFVAAKGNPRAGVIHFVPDDRLWHASNWSGAIGAFETEKEAEAAVWSAPPQPKPKRPPRLQIPSIMRWESLTAADAGCLVRSEGGRVMGAVRPI